MPQKTKLPASFYLSENVLQIAKQLIGKTLVSCLHNRETACKIVETEAYNGIHDRASHAFGGRHTERTKTMYQKGGCSYIYLCYGIHHLFNVVTGKQGQPHAVLIRSGEPLWGHDIMATRTRKEPLHPTITKGPGNLSKALGLGMQHNNQSLVSTSIYISDNTPLNNPNDIVTTTRIGVDYAGKDAFLPYRFYLKKSKWISKP